MAGYLLPDDQPEAERLDSQHEIFRLVFSGKLYFAPVSLDQPSSCVLDLGCGTSVWPIELAKTTPSASVIGTDLGQPQPDEKPPNYTYLTGDFEQPWAFENVDGMPKRFDLIHARLIVNATRNHKFLIQQAWNYLKPGGYFELQDFHMPLRKATPVYAEWAAWFDKGAKAMGIDMQAALKWSGWLAEAGFVNIHHLEFELPIGVRQEDRAKGEDNMVKMGDMMMTNMLKGTQGFSKTVFTRGLGWSEARLHSFLDSVTKDMRKAPGQNVTPVHVIYGQKPLD